MASYRPAGDTNLHDAIRSSKYYELTFILTDGVAATGTRGSGDCASGVDAGCVARALREAVYAESHEGEDTDRGLWIIPLTATYDGTFFTEEPILPTSFQPNETIQRIRSDVGVQAVVQDPHTGYDGRLVFKYSGPRTMLLIVLARWADVGRAAVTALWERAEMLGVRRIDQLKGFTSGLASLPPIEVYPGFLNPVTWSDFKELETYGTIAASSRIQTDQCSIAIECYGDKAGEGDYRLIGTPSTGDQVAGCAPIRLLPAFSFRFRAVRQDDEPDLKQIVKGYDHERNSYADIRLRLACDSSAERNCSDKPIAAQWVAYMKYGKSADCLASPDCPEPGHQLVKALSTLTPSKEPHRIYGFVPTLQSFYQEVASDQRSIALANINICRKR